MALTIDELNIQITSDSQKATRALTSLIKKLEKLKETLSGTSVSNITIANSFNKTTNATTKATVAINKHDAATKKVSKSTQGLSDKMAKNISKWRTLFGAFKSAAQMMGGLFTESNSYIETLNLFNVTMGDAADKSYEFAESVQNLIGIDVAEWMNFQGTFKQLTSGFGVAEEASDAMSQNLTQLSYDLASFFNTDVETAFDKLSSAMAGQVKGLREFGIDTTVASLQEYALAKGIEKSVSKMSQAEKSLLRYNYIMEKSINIQGDMARTLVTPANALRVLSSQLDRMKRAFGNIISVLVARFIPYVQVMVEVVTDAANAMADLFGFELPKIDYSGLDTGGYADDLEDGEEAVNGTSETLKKIKKQLMGFDELNILSNPDSEDGGASDVAGLGGGLNGMQPMEYNFLKDLDASKIEELKEKIKQTIGEIAGIVGGAMLAIGAILTFTGANVPLGLGLMVAGISGVALAIDWAFLENPFGSTLSTLTAIVGGALLALGGLLAFTGVDIPLGIAFLVAGAATLMSAVAINWDGLSPDIKQTLATISGVVGAALLVLGAILAFSGADIPLGIGFLAAGAVSVAASAKLNWDSSTNKVSGVIQTIGAVVGGALLALGAILAFSGAKIPLGIGLMAAGAATIFSTVAPNWNSMSDKTRNTISIISAILGGALIVIGAILAFTGVALPLGIGLIAAGAVSLAAAIIPNWDWVKQKVNSVLAGTLAIISGFGLVIGVLLCLTGAGIGIGLALIFASLKGTTKAASMDDNPVTRFVKNMANGIIKIFNGVIEAINDLFHITFDGLTIAGVQVIPKIDARLVNLPKIPLLAEGGIVGAGQMFIAREAGPELVGNIGRKTAVANNDQIISGIEAGVYRAMTAANSVNKGGSQTIRIINEIDGDVVGEKVIQYHNGKVIQTGVSPLLV